MPFVVVLGLAMSPDEGQEEYEEVKEDLRKREEEVKILRNLIIMNILIIHHPI